MLKLRDLYMVLSSNMMDVIYEDHWNGKQYNYTEINGDMEVKLILPVDEKTIKISVSNFH